MEWGRELNGRPLPDAKSASVSDLNGAWYVSSFPVLSYRKLESALLPTSCCWEPRSVSGAQATGVRTWRLLPDAM